MDSLVQCKSLIIFLFLAIGLPNIELVAESIAQPSIVIAQKKKKRVKPRRGKRLKVDRTMTGSGKKAHHIRGYFGPVVGINEFKSTIYTYGFDYGYSLANLPINALVGFSYWQHKHTDEWDDAKIITQVDVLSLDFGVAYNLALDRVWKLESGLRLGSGFVQVDVEDDPDLKPFGIDMDENDSNKSLAFSSPFVALFYHIFDDVNIGFEVRKHFYFDDEYEQYAGIHLYLHVGYLF